MKRHVMNNAADRQTTKEDAEIIKDTQKVQDDEAQLVIYFFQMNLSRNTLLMF